jgi:hypothetical protein
LGRAFSDLPELPTINNPGEPRGGGAQLVGDDATSTATTNPVDNAGMDETAQHADSPVRQPSAGARTQGPKRTLDTKATTTSASTPKRPCRACTIKTGTMLLGEHSEHLLTCPSIALY